MLNHNDYRSEIADLTSRYNRAIDTGQAEDWAATFTEDGEFHGIVVTCYGRDELTAWVRELWSNPKYAHFTSGQHWTGNMIIDGRGDDAASMWSNLIMVAPGPEEPRVILIGVFEDELRRVDGRWLFARRVLTAGA